MAILKKLSLLSLLLAIVLTGCGNQQSNKAQSGSSESTNTLEAIKKRGKLMAGVKYDLKFFGQKDPATEKVEGFDVDLMKALAKDILGDENKVEFKEATSKTRIELLNKGDVDILAATMAITDERKKQIDFSEPYFTIGQYILVPVNSTVQSIKDLNDANKVIVTAKGAVAGKVAKEHAPNVTVKEYENFAEAFTALKGGKGDALLTDNSLLFGMIDDSKENGQPTYKMVGESLSNFSYGMGIKKGDAEFVKYVNDFLAKIKQNGEYDKIYHKWFGDTKF